MSSLCWYFVPGLIILRLDSRIDKGLSSLRSDIPVGRSYHNPRESSAIHVMQMGLSSLRSDIPGGG
jgi:hypothetical protein